MSQKNLTCNYKYMYVNSIVCQSVIALRQTKMVNEQLVTVNSLFYEYTVLNFASLLFCINSREYKISNTYFSLCFLTVYICPKNQSEILKSEILRGY